MKQPLEFSAEEIEAAIKAKHPNALDDAESEVKAKSDTLAKASESPPPTAADTVLMMAQTKTGQQFLIALIALCMQAEHDGGEVMFVSKKGRARFTVNMKVRHGQKMLFIGEGENLFVASADLHTKITTYMNPRPADATDPNAVPPGDSAPAGQAGDAGTGEIAPPADAPAAP